METVDPSTQSKPSASGDADTPPPVQTPPIDTPPDTSAPPATTDAAGPLDHDADGKKGGAITKAQATALVWVVRAGPGLHRMPRGEALEAVKDGETRLATPRDLAIAGIEQED